MNFDLMELSKRESERVEWKENVADITDLAKTACAFSNDFANMGGGYIVCGAKEIKDEYGFQSVQLSGLLSSQIKQIEGELLSICRQHITPPVTPIVEEIETDDASKRVIVFVFAATGQAHSYKPKDHAPAYYIRVGRQTIEARNGLFRELLVRKGTLLSWDRRTASNCDTSDFDLLLLRQALQKMGLWNDSTSIDDYLSDTRAISVFVPPLLSRESITQKLRPKNFALLLFSSNPLKISPGAYTIISFYPGKDKTEPISQRFEIPGSLITQSEKVLSYLESEVRTLFNKESERPNIIKYPKRAIEEAVVNAIVHRDYESDQPTRITVFQDRMEIISPGGLPSAVSKEKFATGNAPPYWRNQSLAFFMNKLQLAQGEGQGIPTIIKTMRDEGNPDPIFEVESDYIKTVLPAHPRHSLFDTNRK
ncbi:MAG: ATP-binding protein [Candidatus Sumerlaeia bacterium]|nr:ATP-binding protein [Candidatus Sumerlaeia bacterium]